MFYTVIVIITIDIITRYCHCCTCKRGWAQRQLFPMEGLYHFTLRWSQIRLLYIAQLEQIVTGGVFRYFRFLSHFSCFRFQCHYQLWAKFWVFPLSKFSSVLAKLLIFLSCFAWGAASKFSPNLMTSYRCEETLWGSFLVLSKYFLASNNISLISCLVKKKKTTPVNFGMFHSPQAYFSPFLSFPTFIFKNP